MWKMACFVYENSLRLEKITSIFFFKSIIWNNLVTFTPYCKYGNVGLIYFFMNAIMRCGYLVEQSFCKPLIFCKFSIFYYPVWILFWIFKVRELAFDKRWVLANKIINLLLAYALSSLSSASRNPLDAMYIRALTA